MSSTIRLDEITHANWKACIALELNTDQKEFVPSNLYSIAEAQFYEGAKSRAICNEQNQLIGYALWGRDIFTDKWKIFRIMIDKAHQNQGYGKSAIQAIIKQISNEPDGNEVLISYRKKNLVAQALYAKFGFVEQKIDTEGIVTALLKIDLDK